MTDKEFKRLTRPQLIEVIYQLQMKQEELEEENRKLREALEDKRLRIGQAGNIAEAALEINGVMRSAQAAAEQYLQEIRIMRAETEEECRRMLRKARSEVLDLDLSDGQPQLQRDMAVDAILQEYYIPDSTEETP